MWPCCPILETSQRSSKTQQQERSKAQKQYRASVSSGPRPNSGCGPQLFRSVVGKGLRMGGAVKKRCSWVNADDALLLEYHDREWGVPAHSDRKHFEVLVLSGAQAGLNWSLVLKKREGYRRAFHNFDPEKVARYSERKIQILVSNPEIIRNRMKIEAAVRNARAFLKVQEELGDFDSYCWNFVGGQPKLNRWKT